MRVSSPTEKRTSLEIRLGTLKLEASLEFRGWLYELQEWIQANPLKYQHEKYQLDNIQPLWVKASLLGFICEQLETLSSGVQNEIHIQRITPDVAPVVSMSETMLNAYLDAALSIINTNIQILSDYA